MSRFWRGPWRHAAFRTLWAGQATSVFGSYVGGFAYDFAAILTLHASPAQIAMLNGCAFVPPLLVGPWVGLLADRARRRPLLIAADLGRALLLASIPLAAVAHALTMLQLFVVAALVSVLGVLFDVSLAAYLPGVVGAELLVEANSALQAVDSVGEAGGWGIAGLLVQIFSAPLVVLADALSFVVSALTFVRLASHPEPPAASRRQETHWWHEMRAGMEAVGADRVLRALAVVAFVGDLVGNVIGVVILLFFVRELRVAPAILGPLFGLGGVSSLVGAVMAGRLSRRFGLRRTLIGSLYVDRAGLVPVALAAGPLPLVVALLALGQSTDGGRAIYDVHSRSLVQRRAPAHLAGRVNAAFATLRGLAMSLGLAAGGVLGQTIGLRPTLLVAALASAAIPLALRGFRFDDRNQVTSSARATA